MRWLLLLNSLVSLSLIPFVRTIFDLTRALPRIPLRAAPKEAPFVSVLVPARNEELGIERCVGSLLRQRYPSHEVLVLDDRSTDRTGELLERLAAKDERLRIFPGQPRPDGWVGKCWALHQLAEHARGEWLLFVDADTYHQPEMLASCIAFARERGLDLLSLGPHQELLSLSERVTLPAIFGVIVAAGGSLSDVNNPDNPAAKATGQFLLFRGETYRRLGGHEAVRDEIVDDYALARRVKGTGHRLQLADGRDLVSTRMYYSLAEIWEGFSKNAYFEGRRQPAGVVAGAVLPWLAVGLPLAEAALLALRRPKGVLARALAWQIAFQVGALLLFGLQMTRHLRLPPAWALSVPPGLLFFSLVMLNSAWRVLSGQGVTWKGRRYDGAEVK